MPAGAHTMLSRGYLRSKTSRPPPRHVGRPPRAVQTYATLDFAPVLLFTTETDLLHFTSSRTSMPSNRWPTNGTAYSR